MVGRKVNLVVDKKEAKIGEEILKIENLIAKIIEKLPAVKGVNLEVRGRRNIRYSRC